MNPQELRQLSDELTHGTLGPELGLIIRDVLANLLDSSSSPMVGRRKVQLEGDTELDHFDQQSAMKQKIKTAIEVIEQRRLSKSKVTQIMADASPSFDSFRLSPNASLQEQLNNYFRHAPDNESNLFLHFLVGDASDPYLKGISSRD
jgi:hypothetical protein